MAGNTFLTLHFKRASRVLVFAVTCMCALSIALAPPTLSAAPLPGRPDASSPVLQKSLKVYFVDVEGGQATLFVTPDGQSLLIDTGWMGNDGRDADRIVAAAKRAGLSKIDYVLITHFHEDHVGGAPQLAARFPIGTFIDHGENHEVGDAPTTRVWQAYQELLATKKFKHITPKPGDVLPIQGMNVSVISVPMLRTAHAWSSALRMNLGQSVPVRTIPLS